jgi:hypothetical protein
LKLSIANFKSFELIFIKIPLNSSFIKFKFKIKLKLKFIKLIDLLSCICKYLLLSNNFFSILFVFVLSIKLLLIKFIFFLIKSIIFDIFVSIKIV